MSHGSRHAWQFWIDRGGTFTDIVARHPDGRLTTTKLLSENPERYTDAAIAGIKQVLGIAPSEPIPANLIGAIKMGTTVATNALLERRGARTLLLVNTGFADALVIGDQTRPQLFDLAIARPATLYDQVAEIPGRIAADGTEITPLDTETARAVLQHARANGFEACAIALMHAWQYPAHEQRLAELAREAGFTQVSASHDVSPVLRLIPRAQTTVVDATLSPILRRHIDAMLRDLGGTKVYCMQSHGGLTDAQSFRGKDAILSGPAGGIVGAVRTAASAGFNRVVGFDMGGTSTDVALYAGAFERISVADIAGVRLSTPMLAINTVAAGGGSILHFDGARQRVGPDSAGANPGPAAYRRGGPLTVTDANICVGKIQPGHFPAIFGANGDMPLDAGTVHVQFSDLAATISDATAIPHTPEQVAEGFLRIAVNNMANAIRQVSVQKGHDISAFTLVCFGGAGGQHACMVAEELGMDTIFIHPLSGVLSAYGMGLADQTILRERSIEQPLTDTLLPSLQALAVDIANGAAHALLAQGDAAAIVTRKFLHLRYQGTEAALKVPLADLPTMLAAFAAAHRNRFGFDRPGARITVAALAIEATQPGAPVSEPKPSRRDSGTPLPISTANIWTNDKHHSAAIFERETLAAGDTLRGPAIVIDSHATTIIEPGWIATITAQNHMVLRQTEERKHFFFEKMKPKTFGHEQARRTGRPDPVRLEVFNNLFMAIAEQAGAVLQNTAASVNIKERLDFSCAIFDDHGNLVANAPHVPVHLGAMGVSVKAIVQARGTTLKPGDVFALNNPARGGTHLPDITVITPIFNNNEELIFFAANRGHHADIGGTTPGSTPPNSRTLEEEGVVIDDFLLVASGSFRETEFRALLTGARYPARNPDMNVADITAQIASNEAAAQGLRRAIRQHGWPTVRDYMRHVMDNAEESIRRVIDTLHDGRFDTTLDDGSPLRVAVRIDHNRRSAALDFTGTGPQRADNFNAPEAVTRAVVLYVFRCLAGTDIPLNDGCLKPITIQIPPGSFLSPIASAAVVAGNTEVSQAVCCALFGALGAVASSQATMNNVLFGDATRQYYETIGGGAGAGPGFHGASAVHTHMTNTRMTDPEVLELHHPVRVEEFSVRKNSGGSGRWRGGDGIVRRLRFLAPMAAMIVGSSRKVAPFGLAGGGAGATGDQWIDRADGTRQTLAGVGSADMQPGDIFVVQTPGGGGYG